jgi:hypothetical protein
LEEEKKRISWAFLLVFCWREWREEESATMKYVKTFQIDERMTENTA